MRIAIIPAREKSKRIKNKNIKKFLGTPIIEITFKKLKSYKIFDKIVLDTESDKIIKATKYLGFDFIIKRPKSLSYDTTSTYDVINHGIKILNRENRNIKNITCVYPCNPFLKKKLFIEAFKKLQKKNDFSFIIQEFPTPIERCIIEKKIRSFFLIKKMLKKDPKILKKAIMIVGNFILGQFMLGKIKIKILNV